MTKTQTTIGGIVSPAQWSDLFTQGDIASSGGTRKFLDSLPSCCIIHDSIKHGIKSKVSLF